jgi:hypothetical protein
MFSPYSVCLLDGLSFHHLPGSMMIAVKNISNNMVQCTILFTFSAWFWFQLFS